MLSSDSLPEKDNIPKVRVAIVILGGGLTAEGQVYPHTELRIAKAVELYKQYKSSGTGTGAGTGAGAEAGAVVTLIPLSGGTPHKPPPLDPAGFPIAEATAAARVLLNKYNIPASDISEEPYSVDTLGNAYFLRTLHVEPGKYTELHIVTNDWHMARVRAMFQHVFALPRDSLTSSSSINGATCQPPASPKLFFAEVLSGLEPALLEVRKTREAASLASFQDQKHAYTTLQELHYYMFQEHAAYAASRLTRPRVPLDKDVLATY